MTRSTKLPSKVINLLKELENRKELQRFLHITKVCK